MVRQVIKVVRVAALGMSLTMASVAGAQQPSPPTAPENLSWTQPAPREALGAKGSAFLSGGNGSFVSREAMRANGAQIQAKTTQSAADADAQPDLASQFNYVFGGVPGPEATLAGGQRLFTACEPHNCVGRRAFLVTDSGGEAVQSAGFLNVECAVAGSMQKAGGALPASCDTVPTLTIFYPDQKSRQPKLSVEIIKWAREQVAQTKQSDRIRIREQFLH